MEKIQQKHRKRAFASVFIGFSVTVVRTMLDRNLKKGFIWPAGYLVHHERKPRCLRQELQQRPQENTVYCLAPHGLLSLLPHSTRDYLSRGRLGSSTLIIDQENAPQTYS